jgi:hypothetical protein
MSWVLPNTERKPQLKQPLREGLPWGGICRDREQVGPQLYRISAQSRAKSRNKSPEVKHRGDQFLRNDLKLLSVGGEL